MSDEVKLVGEREAGHKASRVLDNAAFLMACEKIKDRVWREFATAPKEELFTLQMQLKTLDQIIRELRHTMDSGKMADHELRGE